jgi:phage terminase small subunit
MSRAEAEATLVHPHLDAVSNYLSPPADLLPEEREQFLNIVSACAPNHFRESDTGLLIEYTRARLQAQRAADELRAGGEVLASGKLNPWLQIQRQSVRAMTQLARTLRLTPQARAHPRSIGRQTPASMSAYDREEAFGHDN